MRLRSPIALALSALVTLGCGALLSLPDPTLDPSLGASDAQKPDGPTGDASNDQSTQPDTSRVDGGGDAGAETLIARSGFHPWGLAINDTYLFFTEYLTPPSISRANKDGTNVIKLASGINGTAAAGFAPTRIKADATDVYWLTVGYNGNPAVLKCAAAGCGGTPTDLVNPPLQFSPYFLALSTTHVYFSLGNELTVRRVSKMGGPAELVATLADKPSGLYVDADKWLYIDDDDGSVTKVDISGAFVVSTIVPAGAPKPSSAITATASRAIYTQFADPGVVSWVSTSGADSGAGTYVAQASNPIDIANDGVGLYWANQGSGGFDGEISTCSLAGNCTPKVLATGYEVIKQMAVDNTHVYFSYKGLSGDGAIMRVHK